MASITINNIDDYLKQQLQHQADKHGVSPEEEALRILQLGIHQQETKDAKEASAKQLAAWKREDERKPKRGLGTEIHERFKGSGIADLEPLPRAEIQWEDADRA